MSNIAKIYRAIATSNGRGRCKIGDVDFPVALKDVDVCGIGPSTEVAFRCEVLHEDDRATAARAFQNAVDAYEAALGGCSIKGSLRTGYTYTNKNYADLNIKKVIFNDPATIVIWKDGEKTVVKAINEPFDPEKGLAMAIVKKAFGNKGNYFNVLKKWLPEEPPVNNIQIDKSFRDNLHELKQSFDVLRKKIAESGRWCIWMRYYDLAGNEIGTGVHPVTYSQKGSATRRAKQLWGDNPQVKWTVSQTNPWTNDDDIS